ncbi:MAG: peptidoglycan-binding protein [Phycisphaeraceae bacterium]|nr:peptidoglycan-binding protein [Phycisphaeraceae bacterium]
MPATPTQIEPVSLTVGGVAASVTETVRPYAVAPTLESKWNTLRERLAPVGCWRASDVRFEFDSSVPRPELRGEMRVLKRRIDAHEGCLLSVFGHADPVGDSGYNKQLSGRRAQAIYGLVTRRVDLWEELYSSDPSWKDRGVGVMLVALEPAGDDDSAEEPATLKDQLKAFQQRQGLSPSGQADAPTRKKLFQMYMDLLCVGADDKPWTLAADRFLGRGADSKGKADYQGCGEFNPILMLSASELQKFEQSGDKAGRNAANAPNRRVLILLFPKELEVDVAKWPCPRASEGTSGCQKRLWSDSSKRLSNTSQRREYKDTRDTFGCRFYERIAGLTPCELQKPIPMMVIRIQLHDYCYKPCPGVKYRLLLESGEEIKGVTDGEGWLVQRVISREQRARIVYRPEGEEADLESIAIVSASKAEDDAWVDRHVQNFGFRPEKVKDALVLFQAAHKDLKVTGEGDDQTRKAIRDIMTGSMTEPLENHSA